MNLTPELNALLTNLGTIAAEVALTILVFVVLSSLVKRIIVAVGRAPALSRRKGLTKSLQSRARTLFTVLAMAAVLAEIGINLYWMYKGHALPEYTIALVQSIPKTFWIDLGFSVGKILALTIVAAIALRFVHRALAALGKKAKAIDGLQDKEESIDGLFRGLKVSLAVATWLVVISIAVMWLDLPRAVSANTLLALRIYLILSAAIVIWRVVGLVINSADALSERFVAKTDYAKTYERLQPLIPLLRRSAEYVIMVTAATLVVMQVEAISTLAEWGPRIIQVIGIAFMARVIKELVTFVMEEAVLRRPDLAAEQKQRRATMVPLFASIIAYGIYFVAGVMILNVFGLDPTPILAGAGIVGLAVGLGAQNLINDMVSGFFILFEEHYLVGDFIKICDAEGRVVHYSKGYTNAVVDVGVAYESDLNKVFKVLGTVGEQIKAANEMVLEPTAANGLDNFGESELLIRTVTRVKPGCHLQVERDLRRRIMDAFDASDIEIPYPRRVLISQNAEEATAP